MKNIIVISLLLFVLCQIQNAQVKSITSEQIALMDSLLSDGNIAPLDSCLISDMPPVCNAKENSITFPWDSVKSEYVALLQRLKRISTDEQPTTQNLTAIYEVNAERFQKRFAGKLAENSFNKFRQQTIDGATKEAMKYYLIANDFREKYIIAEKIRLRNNAERVKIYLTNKDYEEAGKLIQLFQSEDQQSIAFRTVSQSFKKQYDVTLEGRYERYAEDLRHGIYFQEEEAQTGFRTIDYSVGIGIGASLLIEEPWPSFYENYVTISDFRSPGKTLYGYSTSLNFSYYLNNKWSLDIEFLCGEVKRQREAFISDYVAFAGIKLPITISSISIIGNRRFFINTNIRPVIGFGVSYSFFETYANGTFFDEKVLDVYPYPDKDPYQYNGCRERAESIRFILRPGVEYIPSESSNLSYSFLIDASINLHSTEVVSTICLFPRFRVSWLF